MSTRRCALTHRVPVYSLDCVPLDHFGPAMARAIAYG